MDEIEQLSELIGVLLDAPLPDGDEALCEMLVALHRLQDRLAALKAKTMAEVDTRRAYAADGSKSVGAWLARQCHASRAETQAEARSARRLKTSDAWEAIMCFRLLTNEGATLTAPRPPSR